MAAALGIQGNAGNSAFKVSKLRLQEPIDVEYTLGQGEAYGSPYR